VVGNGEHLTIRVPNKADSLGMPWEGALKSPKFLIPKWIIKHIWLKTYPKPEKKSLQKLLLIGQKSGKFGEWYK